MSEKGLPSEGAEPVSPPSPTEAPTAEPIEAGAAAETQPPRRRQLDTVIGAIVVVTALVGSLVAVQLTRPSAEAKAQTLAFAFTPGRTQTNTLHMEMEGTLAMEATGSLASEMPPDTSSPLSLEMTETGTMKVLSVDDQGVATIESSISDVSGTIIMNGITVPIPSSATNETSTRLKITSDGRLLEVDGQAVPSWVQGMGAGFPGTDQYTPLPDHPVKPGDSWTESQSMDIPLGKDKTWKIVVTNVSTLDRYETVNGVEAAVITTKSEMPLDFTIDALAELGQGFEGHASPSPPSDNMDLSGVSLTLMGEISASTTVWFDPSAKDMLRDSGTADVDVKMDYARTSQGSPGSMTITFKGTISTESERR
jgi:hypothetical protein